MSDADHGCGGERELGIEVLAGQLAGCLDGLVLEILHDVYANATIERASSKAVANEMWELVVGVSALPAAVAGEMWLAALDVATREDTAFGWLCRAAAVARHQGVSWAEFAESIKSVRRQAAGAGVAH